MITSHYDTLHFSKNEASFHIDCIYVQLNKNITITPTSEM